MKQISHKVRFLNPVAACVGSVLAFQQAQAGHWFVATLFVIVSLVNLAVSLAWLYDVPFVGRENR